MCVFQSSTVDGRNPAPPGMYKTMSIMGYLLYQLVQDFFHQQYHKNRTIHPPKKKWVSFIPDTFGSSKKLTKNHPKSSSQLSTFLDLCWAPNGLLAATLHMVSSINRTWDDHEVPSWHKPAQFSHHDVDLSKGRKKKQKKNERDSGFGYFSEGGLRTFN